VGKATRPPKLKERAYQSNRDKTADTARCAQATNRPWRVGEIDQLIVSGEAARY
jgi:hypothetical protein